MKLTPILSLGFALLLLINLNVCSVESRTIGHHPPGQGQHPPGQGHHNDDHGDGGHKHGGRHHHHAYDGFSFYVFGDSFADNGNLPKTYPQSELSRQWYPPYLVTGRFSNGMVQSDLVANAIGQSKSPPAHREYPDAGPAGMNFAAAGSGAFDVPGTTTLRRQVHTFSKLVKDGDIKEEDLAGRSVALVAVSGNDYAKVFAGITAALVENVTAEIVANVARLQDLGVEKVLVNNLYPLGCAPSRTRLNKYASCDKHANQVARIHNHQLTDKLAGMDGVLVLDLSAAFFKIVGSHPDGDMTNLFPNRLVPCCESMDPMGYCGQVVWDSAEPLYKVCENPDSYFFWDDMNPTEVGWEAVMGQLIRPISDFLELRR